MNLDNQNIDHDLLMAYLLGEATDDQREKVDIWLSESEDNQIYLDELEQIWIDTGKLDPVPILVDIDSAWSKVTELLNFEENNKVVELKPKIEKDNSNKLFRIAAIFLLIAASMFIITHFIVSPTEQTLTSELEIVEDTLPDGSLIALNINSKIIFPEEFNDDTREVSLEGEAFFNVSHDKGKPFIIHSEDANIKVLGTSFNVKAYQDMLEVEVVVESGTIMLFGVLENGDTSSVILNQGEKGIFDKKEKKARKISESVDDEIFWNKRKLIFEETELLKVFEILEKSYNVKILVNNPSIMNCIYTATFIDNNIDDILQVIKESYKLSIIKENNTYIIDGEGC